MKRLLCFLLPLLFLTPDITVGGENGRAGEAVTGVGKKVSPTKKSRKKKRKGTRRSYRGRKWKKRTTAAKRGTKQSSYNAKRYAAAKTVRSKSAVKSRSGRKAIVRSRRRPVSKLASRSSLAAGSAVRRKAVAAPKEATVAKRQAPPPAPRKPVRPGWRGDVRRSLARTAAGAPVPIEEFGDMNSFLQTLPDDGEIRVRYGIYPGPKVMEHPARFDRERRNVRVGCWLHGVATDSAEGDLTSPVRLLIGSSPDSSLAVFMYARVPGADPARPSAARDSLLGRVSPDLTPGRHPTEIIFLTPRPIVLEGALYFNGRRDAGKRYDLGRSRTSPLTVWEIQPVVALENSVDGRLTGSK